MWRQSLTRLRCCLACPAAYSCDHPINAPAHVCTAAEHRHFLLQGIVSCNQLLRQLVPLLVDIALLSLDQRHGSTAQQQAAVQQLLQQRLATNMAGALGLPAATAENEAARSAALPPQQACAMDQATTSAEEMWQTVRPIEPVAAALLHQGVQPGSMLRLSWDARQLQAAGAHGLLLMATAAPPCSHWGVAAVHLNGSTRQLAHTAASLPPLLPELQQRWVPRYWLDLVQGVSWMHNATRLLYVPFTGAAGRPLASISLAAQGSTSGSTAVLAQVLDAHPSQIQLQLPPPGTVAHLSPCHAAALALQLPQQQWPLDGDACSRGSSALGASCLTLLLLGSTPPWNLRIQTQQCGNGDGAQLRILPALVAVQTGTVATDSVRVAMGPSAGSQGAVVQLWSGMTPLDQLLFISDPSCAYTLR